MIDLAIALLGPFLFLYPFISQYKIMQYVHYETNKYFKFNMCKKVFVQLIGSSFFCVFLFVSKLDKIVLLISSLILLNLILTEKGDFRYTNRIKRVIASYFIVSYSYFFLPFNKIFLLMGFILGFYIFFVVIHFISSFLEHIILNIYIKDAKKIIKDVKIIGITGSYGKTSCKNIIYDMLSRTLNVSKTPKSFNNKVGIVKSIRECVSKDDDYFICEYGVDKKKAMNKLLNIARPNICLISEIGPQHLLTFKSVENIKEEKLKIAKILDDDEFAIINNDNIYLRESINCLKCKVITYGIKNKSNVMAKNIIMNSKGSSFDLYINNKKYKNVKISLLGEHNVQNFLGSVGVLMAAGIDLNNINMLASCVKVVEHRLESKVLQGVKIIDDGYNSNELGFKKAIDVLSFMPEEKYVITPGIIEQGKNSLIVNYELGKYMVNKIDFAILVEENANVIKEGLLANGFKEENIIIKNNFKEAWEYVKSINNNNKIFLIENDLPSIYLK